MKIIRQSHDVVILLSDDEAIRVDVLLRDDEFTVRTQAVQLGKDLETRCTNPNRFTVMTDGTLVDRQYK